MITLFLQALLAGILLVVAAFVFMRLAPRIGLALPRARRRRRRGLRCVRPLDFDA